MLVLLVCALPASAATLPILAWHDWWPVYSPDAQSIAFTRVNGQGRVFTLEVVAAGRCGSVAGCDDAGRSLRMRKACCPGSATRRRASWRSRRIAWSSPIPAGCTGAASRTGGGLPHRHPGLRPRQPLPALWPGGLLPALPGGHGHAVRPSGRRRTCRGGWGRRGGGAGSGRAAPRRRPDARRGGRPRRPLAAYWNSRLPGS